MRDYGRRDAYFYGQRRDFDEDATDLYDPCDEWDPTPGGITYSGYETVEVLPYPWVTRRAPNSIDGVTIGAVGFVVALIFGLWWDGNSNKPVAAAPENTVAENTVAAEPTSRPVPTLSAAPPTLPSDPAAIIAPYDSFILTQGLHGFSYGHMAIDLKAGQGAIIRSPIEGVVSALYVDEIGNPTIVIENDYYQVTMLHGEYTVALGDQLKIGQPVGRESNLGNTKDWAGNSCRGRNCGYHTHLNIFDKRLGSNANPLQLLKLSPAH